MNLISRFILMVLLVSTSLLAGNRLAFAVEPHEILKDPALEKRARNLSAQLRCLVCQNQSIDDSDAQLARDLRVLVRDRLKEGDSDPQVMKFLTDRYGDFILLKPPFKWSTALLWLAPPLVLLLGIWGFLAVFKNNRTMTTARANSSKADNATSPSSEKLSEKEEEKLKKLLES